MGAHLWAAGPRSLGERIGSWNQYFGYSKWVTPWLQSTNPCWPATKEGEWLKWAQVRAWKRAHRWMNAQTWGFEVHVGGERPKLWVLLNCGRRPKCWNELRVLITNKLGKGMEITFGGSNHRRWERWVAHIEGGELNTENNELRASKAAGEPKLKEGRLDQLTGWRAPKGCWRAVNAHEQRIITADFARLRLLWFTVG